MAIESSDIRSKDRGKPVRFAHPAEADVAAVLDHFGIEWEYEPTTFVLARDEDGAVSRAFCPDFYLPLFDCYIEVTTQKQKLITKKHHKINAAREKFGVKVILVNKSGVEMIRKVYAEVLDSGEDLC